MENYYRRKVLVERILQLAEQNATGTPDELAARLGISKRTLLRIISSLKENGTAIVFCKKTLSYTFTPPINMLYNIFSLSKVTDFGTVR